MSADPTATPTPDESQTSAGQALADVLKNFNDRLTAIEDGQKKMSDRYEMLAKAVIKIDERTSGNQPTGGQAQPGQPSIVESILGRLDQELKGMGGGGGGLDPLSQELLNMQRQSFLTWQKGQIREFAKRMGIDSPHVTVE